MSKNDTLSQLPSHTRIAIQAFKKVSKDGQAVLLAMLDSNTRYMAQDKEHPMRLSPATSAFRAAKKRKNNERLFLLDFRLLLGLMRAGFGEMPSEADDEHRYRRFWITDEVWDLLQEVREHLTVA